MKCLTHDEIVKIVEDAFQAGYQSGADNADGMLHVEDSQEYLKKVLKEIGEARFPVIYRGFCYAKIPCKFRVSIAKQAKSISLIIIFRLILCRLASA